MAFFVGDPRRDLEDPEFAALERRWEYDLFFLEASSSAEACLLLNSGVGLFYWSRGDLSRDVEGTREGT